MNLVYFLVFVVALPSCFSAPGSISFQTTQVEVDEIDSASVSLNIQRTGGSDGEINFLCKILNSTGNDFDELTTTGKFLSGETSATTNFYIEDDTEAEGNETFVVQLSLVPGSTGSVTDPRFANIKIIANDDAYGIVGFDMPNSIRFHEPRTSGTSKPKYLRIQRQVAAYGPITVYWKVDPKDPKDNDIYPTTGVVHFQNGEKNKSLEFFVRTDNIIEQDEEFTFELTSVSGGAKLNNTLSKVLVTISTNDIPVRFAMNHITVPENQSSVVIWIYRGLDPTGTIPITSVDLTSTVSWYLKSDGAVSNQDFSHSNGTVMFSNGDTKKSFMVTILEDDVPELSENFTVHLTSLSPDITLVSPTMSTIEILQSDDHAGVFGLTGNGSILLSEDGGDSASITIERTAGRFGRIVLTWKAMSTGRDLAEQISPTNGTVVFNDGEQYKAINIAVRQDFIPEEAFSFVVELIGVSVGRLTDDPSGRTQKVIVQDSDDVYGVFEFADDSYQKLSLASYPRMVDFVVDRNGGHLGTVDIGYDIKYLLPDGSDHSSAISIPTSGSVSMVSGQQNASVNFTISQEGFVQANSVFRILLTSVHLTEPAKTLVSPITPRLGTRQNLNLTVHAQFADGEIGFEITTMSVTEPENGQTKQVKIRVLRDGTFYKANLLWSIVGVKTSDDVTPTSGSITFEKGDNSVNITIQILPDSLPELDESFTLRLHNVSEPNQKLQPGSNELVLTIKHNDNAGGTFQFENVGSIILHETIRSQFTVSVIRIGGDLDQRFVKIETTNGKDDFESSGAVLQFDKGVRRMTKTFFVADDNIPEANETLTFRLISFGRPGQQGRLGNATEFSVTILANDDPNGIIVFLNTSLSIVESKDDRKSARFFLERTRGLFGQVAVFWNATSTVTSSLDVSPTFGNVMFSPGERFKILEIYSLSDNIPELNENFTLKLTQVEGGAKIGNPREALLTIIRNDDAIEFAAPTHVRIPEGQRAYLTILRKGRHDETIVVNYTTRDGSATSDDGDYTPISDQVVFARGDVQKTISVLVLDDNKPESDENFTVVLTSSSGDTAIYGNTVAIVTIAASDDPNGIFHFDGNTVLNKTESEGKIVRFSVIRDRGIFGTVDVLWQVYQVFPNGSRVVLTSGDFEQTSGVLVFEDRVQSKDLQLKVLADQIAEYEEKFEVVLVNVTGGHPGPGGKLSNTLTVAYLQVPTNDNPYGLFAFGANSLNVSVAEDTMPGFEYEAIVNLTVVRERGRDRDVGVSWCIYKTDEAVSLGNIWDLVFLSKIVSSGVVESTRKKRPNTGTKVLEFTDSYAVVNAFGKVPAKGFTVSAWLRLLPGHYGTILAKEATSTTSFYKLGIDTNTKITVEIMTTEGQMTASSNVNTTILDDSWHNVMVTIHNETGVQFFYDGDYIGTNSSVKFTEILDDQGDLYLGVSKPNVDQFRGILQDVKIFTKILQESEIKFIANPVSDVKPINGYLSYPASVTSHVVAITTVNNFLAEDEKMFAVILVSSSGGADIAPPRSSRATITVRKSDNANGLFAFSSSQSLSRIVDEETVRNISFQVQRTRGLHGQVSIVWEVTNENGSRANEDFIQPFGMLVFHDGEDEKTLTVLVYHDKKPELLERFSLRLVSAHSNDGKTESTPTSGASISAVSSVCNITIEANDSPYGLLQFSSSPPTSGGVVPLVGAFRVGVRESSGVLKLYIVRAQGTLGAIQCSWKTVPMTARADVDYREDAGTVSFLAGEKSVSIDINIIDNDKPELNKTFRVELYGATNGAEIGPGGVAVVVILPSDDAFGVINFTSSSLSKVVTEGQTVNLQVQRSGGGLGAITIYWKVDGLGDNLVESSGEVLMNANQRTASLSFAVKEDMIPELSKSFLLRLTNVSSGRLASSGITSNITVLANDDPHGVFVFDPVLLSVEETNKNITLNIVRQKGTMGKTRVYYTSVPNSVLVKDVVYQRATANQDYRPVSGFVDFQPNQTLGSVVLTIIDDVIPEDNETVVVNLTSVILISDPVIQPEADGSPRIGVERLAQVVILRNDNASGIIRLSASAITVTEDTVGAFLSVIRSIGTFGEITVNIEVSPVTAQPAKDYTVNSNTVTIRDGQTNATVPVFIINDAASEFSETFIVRLLPKGQDGNILLGSPSECTVTIQESDYPYGLIGFSVPSLNQIVSEPSSNNKRVTLHVLRHYGYGTLGVVRFEWRVTLHGRLATNDVQQTKGGSLIRPGENKTSFDIVILADTVPEINEVLLVSLNITEGSAELNPDRRIANVTIQLNDEAHGVVEFGQETYTVQEKDQNTTAHIPTVRKRGTHGDLRVYYSTLQSTSSYAAIAYQDYIPVANASVTIADGTNVSAVDILIIGDNTPELAKSFNIFLERVELINSVTSSRPRIGAQSSTNVTIEDDDHVYGLFKIFAEFNRSRIFVNETDGLAVSLKVQRYGGDTGNVGVKAVISSESTARESQDFKGSDVTFSFRDGEHQKYLTLSINSDDIPERDETIVVKLVNPTGGASVAKGTGNNVTVVILANDVVAGKIGFSLSSQAVVVKEGQVIVLNVIRTSPAAGTVTVGWVIQGENVTKDFNVTSGTVQFNEGQNTTFIKTQVLADNTSEIDEQFQVILRNPMTSGVSWTGAAQINTRMGTATVTVAASNEPHGVLEFQQSSRRVTVRENENILKLSVARLFGNIGTIRLYFTILNNSVHHLTSDERLAIPGEDVDVENSSITIEDGVSVGEIPIHIVNDSLAELDEIFLVNITRVELVHSSSQSVNNETFTPPRLGRYLTSEVKIEENDGTHGILVFSPSRVRVPENITVFNLTVLRSQGTFGDIEVSYFINKLNISEKDFSVYGDLVIGGENTLKFVNGQRTQNITVFIYDDDIPEGDEVFEVRLKKTFGGATLGREPICIVTVVVNDAGNGIFRFDQSSLHMFVDEPGNRHVGTTKASFSVLRQNGTIGEVVIGWSIANESASMDFRFVNGSVTFKDGERRKSFEVETVVDTTPEKKERFLIVLSVLAGGGDLMSPSQAWLTVSENDAPYGEFGFAVSPHILSIEETVGFTEVKVLRHKGTYGRVTVDYHTTSLTADGSSGAVMKFGIFQSFKTQSAQTWYPFSAYGKQYLLLGTSNMSISGNHDNADAYIGSSLYYWQGVYTHISEIQTNNAVQWESFNISDQYYIAVANQGSEDYEVSSTIYKLHQNGTVRFYQNILTRAASDVKFFKPSGSSSSYLIFSNMKDNTGNTAILSQVYKWSSGQFVQHGSGLNCRGASSLTLFTINGRDMLSISSFYDSVNKNFQSKSVIFEWRNERFGPIQEVTTNGATGVEYFKIDSDHFLLFVNSRSSPSLYKWSGITFILHQDLSVSNATAIKEFSISGEVFLTVTLLDGSSQLFKWYSLTATFQFYTNITDSGAVEVQPITLQDPVVKNVSLLAVAMAGASESRLLQPVMMAAQADFIPRSGQLIFENGDTELSVFITVFKDTVSEPDETFLISLSNSSGGSILSADKNLEVNILSNGNPYGRLSFATSSVSVIVNERTRDSKVYLEVLREQGRYGEVIVAWNGTGNATGRRGDGDIFPTSGKVIFQEGETRKTINLTIVADDVPEVNEVLVVSLTSLEKDGSDIPNRGAIINTARDTATVVIKANDEPHGIVGWQRTVVLAQESEATNSTVQLVVERLRGNIGDIEISFETVKATSRSSSNERPAVPYQDFIPVADVIVMADGVNITTIVVNVIHDDNAEVNEIFFVNITAVRLLHSYSLPSENSPQISPFSQTAKVVISENDNKRGELNFNTSNLLDPRSGILKIDENVGELLLHVVRSGGTYGRVGFEYRLVPETVNNNDYFPTKGQIIFQPNETLRVLEINVTDDNEAEVAERFRVEMTQPIGGAKLGNQREVTVEIRASDQPYGVFEFTGPSSIVMEEGREVHLTVARLQGSFREVHVKWNLSVGAFPDVYPANGTLTFEDNITSQVIRLRARDDTIPEGDRAYVCYLVSADNGGVIGSENSVRLRLDANDDGYGVMAVDPATSSVYVGEPDLPSYNGQVTISVVRNAGTYGEILVDWELTSDDGVVGEAVETFNQTRGTVVFADGVKLRNISLQVKQDSYPEETGNYTFRLTGTRDARIDQSASQAAVVVVSSDHPYGIIEFDGLTSRNVSENIGQVILNVIRHKGHNGKLLVTINVVTHGATEGEDFQISPKVLIIDDKKDYGSINVSILAESVPELSESFTLTLGNIELITPRQINFGYKDGLQVDMPPEVGKHNSVGITIMKNDDVHGVVEFMKTRRVVHEHDKSTVISIVRSGGAFGIIRASYTVTNITAEYGKDYRISDGSITFDNGQHIANLTIPLLDDNLPEDRESFRLELTSVNGGARLGVKNIVQIIIETSDNPDGLFGFVGKTRYVLSNPNATQVLSLEVSRIGGARSLVRVKIRVFKTFPSPAAVTIDVSPETKELTFQVDDFGPKQFELSILPFLEPREVEEHFVVSITDVSGNASIDSLTSNVTVVILKHGMPNGLFGFSGPATKTVSEGGVPVVLMVQRKEGQEGTVEVKWAISNSGGPVDDFVNNAGNLIFLPDEENKQISLTVNNDDIPELNEEFTVTLLTASGGGDIDKTSSSARIIISANDNPHGRFRLRSNAQRVTVEGDLSRILSFTIERLSGRFGNIRVDYTLKYSKNYPSSLNGYVTIQNGENEKTQSIVLDNSAFLSPGSHFTLTLSGVSYEGPGVSTDPPTLISSDKTENIAVPDRAANSVVKFKDGSTTLSVNQGNQVPRVFVSRDGLYGSVTVFIDSGYPDDRFPGFTKGLVQPSVSSISFDGNDRDAEFSVQVTPVLVPKQKLIYAVYLSRVTTPANVHGGSKIDTAGQTAIIEPGGVIVVAMVSQNIVVKETEAAQITVYRLFSCVGPINVKYSTRNSSSASSNKDYREISSEFSMAQGEYKKNINVKIINDTTPELDETFTVHITGVSGADTRLGINTTSTITIEDDDSPHGILSFATTSVTVFENVTVVDIIISRSGGTFGDVGVQVRTIGGGELWESSVRTEIKNVLKRRETSRAAQSGDDYTILNTRVTFKNEVPTPLNGQNKTVQLYINNDDKAELNEEIFLYLSDPTGEAVLANLSTGGQSWAIVTIEGNDLMNGKIGFEKLSLTIDEDNNPQGEIKVTRTPSLGTAKVKWQALNSNGNLLETNGTITFAPNQSSSTLVIELKQDNTPELESNFQVKLVSLVGTREASIDPAKNVVDVLVLASDDPAGLISFDKESRNFLVDVTTTRTVSLTVTRAQGTHGKVTVSYRTTMLLEQYTDGELVINRAIEEKDYNITKGTLVFDAGKKQSDKIVIHLTLASASSSSYPKAFNVRLSSVTGGARLNAKFSTTMVIISNTKATTQFLKLRSDSLRTPLSNSDMTRVLQSLRSNVERPPLTASHVSIVADVLNTILDDNARRADEKQRTLTEDVSDLFMKVFDILLNPEREDLQGKSQLTEPFVKYAFALIHGEPCPGTSVVRKTGKYATVEGRRRYEKDINGLILKSSSGRNFFTYPSDIYQTTVSSGTSSKCNDVHFIEYLTDHWFNKDNNKEILNNRVLSTSVKNVSETNPNTGLSFFRIYTGERRVTPKGAECLKWRDGSWDDTICSVKDESDDYVECQCSHFSNFAVRAQSDDRVGYQFYFYISAFICMISFFLVILSHHTCSVENTFSSKLLMHMFFAGFALHLLVVVTAYVSPDLTDKPKQCTALGILIHYFLLAHFSWIFVQSCNLWRILVLNDERTDRKFLLYFMLGWGVPVVFVALYVIITHALYGWDFTEIYADVHKNGDMCFISNGYGALASVLGPVLLFLLAVGVVATQAYQVTLQWKLYDDIFRGHHNIKEVVHLWVVFVGITLTWLFGGLHLAYGKQWLAILFAIFELFTGLYVFMVYFILRNQCRRKYRSQDAYLLNASSPSTLNGSPTDYYAERPVMYDAQSLQSLPKSDLRLSPPDGNEWADFEYDGATPKGSRRVFNDPPLAQLNPLYDYYHGNKTAEANEDGEEEEELSQDFNNLIFALKTGETLEDDTKEDAVELKPESLGTEKLELRRVSIADTHV